MKQAVVFNSTISRPLRRKINKINYLSLRRYCKGLGFEDARIPSGAYGVYYRRGNIGIKVLRTKFTGTGIGGYKSAKRARLSSAWRSAVEEFAALRIADWTGHAPIPYCVKVVRLGSKYFPAIFMEHLHGIILDRFCEWQELTSQEESRVYKGLDELEEVLTQKCGVDHSYDSGASNAIVVKYKGKRIKQIKLIDFTPGLVEIDPKSLEEALEDLPELWGHKIFGFKYLPSCGLV